MCYTLVVIIIITDSTPDTHVAQGECLGIVTGMLWHAYYCI